MKVHKTVPLVRRLFVLTAIAGATTFQLQNCSPTVRTTILDGVSTSLTTFITTLVNSFFVTLTTVRIPTTQQAAADEIEAPAAFPHAALAERRESV